MVVDISPFQRLVCLSDNFKIAFDEAGGSVEKVFLRSVETPSEAFFLCPKKISRLFYRVWGFVRSFFGWDKVRKYDQEANISIIRSLFQEALSDLSCHDSDEVRRVIEFVTRCDRLAGTDKGRVIFANYVLGQVPSQVKEALKESVSEVFIQCMASLPQIPQPGEALNRVCTLAPALRVDSQETGIVADILLARQIQSDTNPLKAWREGILRLQAAHIDLPEDSKSCDAILEKLTQPIPEDILRSLFQEKLSPAQLDKVCFLADDLFAAGISTLQTVLPTWEKIRSIKVGEIPVLPQTSQKMVEQLVAASQEPLSERYRIFCSVRDFLTPDQKKEIVKAWFAPLDPQKPPLIHLKDRLLDFDGTNSVLSLDEESFHAVMEGYQRWLQSKKKTLSNKKAAALAQGLFDLNVALEQELSQIALVCPQSFREQLINEFRRVTIQEMKPLLLKIKKEIKVAKKNYEKALQSHHQLTSMKGQLLSLPNCDERSECLQQLDKLLKELDAYLEKENPGAHVAEGAST